MNGYTKLFNSILTSTVWRQDLATKVVWITMLALADRHGIAESSIPGLAHFAGVELADCERALQYLQSPDKYSRTPNHEGRRIEVIEGGWRLLNYPKYRERISPEDVRERDRIRKQRYREQRKGPTEDGIQVGQRGTTRDMRDCPMMSRQAEADTDAKAKTGRPSSSAINDDAADQATTRPCPREPSQEGEELALLLRNRIRRNKPDAHISSGQLRNWALAADRMLRLDGRRYEQVAAVIEWSQGDEFWAPNVLSMNTVREKFDQLELKRERAIGGNGAGRNRAQQIQRANLEACERAKAVYAKPTENLQPLLAAAGHSRGAQ